MSGKRRCDEVVNDALVRTAAAITAAVMAHIEDAAPAAPIETTRGPLVVA